MFQINEGDVIHIDAGALEYKVLNDRIREAEDDCIITGCCGQRFIAAGMSVKNITIEGIPGNALGAYLNGASITVNGNAQDAVGDTMNEGSIIVRGSIGDAAGYAMRGGRIFVTGNAGYRAGIHMKAYKDKIPLMVIGGCAGSFLGEYQAGGVIVVLGIGVKEGRIVGSFPCTGMHGGKMFLHGGIEDIRLPDQVSAKPAETADLDELVGYGLRVCAALRLRRGKTDGFALYGHYPRQQKSLQADVHCQLINNANSFSNWRKQVES